MALDHGAIMLLGVWFHYCFFLCCPFVVVLPFWWGLCVDYTVFHALCSCIFSGVLALSKIPILMFSLS